MSTAWNLSTIAFVLLLTTAFALADTVEMRDGSLVQGKYVGGTSGTIRIDSAGEVKVIETSNVLALTFGAGATPSTAPVAAAAAQPAAAAPAAAKAVSVPAGTLLTIRLDSAVSSKDPEGKKFSGKLLADLLADGKAIA